MYIERHMEKTLSEIAAMYPVVLVTGARQVGKTTMIRKAAPEDLPYVTLDDYMVLRRAKENPELFFKTYEPTLIIDEVQYEPSLFSPMKMLSDETHKSGLFYLTGSQAFHLMKNVTESLAGRVGILELKGFSMRELKGVSYRKPFLPTTEYINEMKKEAPVFNYRELFGYIQRGFFPAVYEKGMDGVQIGHFFNNYVRTYLERDVRALTQVADETAFIKFLTAAAALTGQQLNYTKMAQTVGKDVNTIKRWLSILVTSGLVYLLEPYGDNLLKRLSKMPKLYFTDTDLACALCGWVAPDLLANGVMAGAMFETFVIGEIIKSYTNAGIDTRFKFSYYRNEHAQEIDLIISDNGKLYPIEIKMTGNPKSHDVKSFGLLEKSGREVAEGGIVCMAETPAYLTEKVRIIPVNLL